MSGVRTLSLLPAAAQRYLDKSACSGPWSLTGDDCAGFAGAVVIPSLAEGDGLFATLQSLAANPPQRLAGFLVVVVVNHGEHASVADRRQNRLDLVRLSGLAQRSRLCLAWVDAASSGWEVPGKLAGVGFARKLGMDLALPRLNWSHDPLLVCLDADTLVEANYLESVVSHFRRSPLGAAVLPYRHQAGGDAAQQAAIDRYELFLRSYVYGLRLARSPYAFNSVGSAMACRASAYVRCGGMNCRKAGEDFYFLQKLAKTDGVDLLTGTTVFPEPRVSERVPFGTGRSMGRLLQGDAQAVLFYPAKVFRVLADWIRAVEQEPQGDAEMLLTSAGAISPVLVDYLEQANWRTVWPRLQSTHRTEVRLLQAFHVWFDGFRTMRLIHLLCDSGHSRGEPEDVLPDYFSWEGCGCPGSQAGMLGALRLHDGAKPLIRMSKI
jgi:hypothetical protein